MSLTNLNKTLKLYEDKIYEEILIRKSRPVNSMSPEEIAENRRSITELEHLLYMAEKMTAKDCVFSPDKTNRWLGFIQGVLWTRNLFTIDQMREHNR